MGSGPLMIAVAIAAGVAIVVAYKRRRWTALAVASILGLALLGAFTASWFATFKETAAVRRTDAAGRQTAGEYFGNEPQLLAVAEQIVAGDPAAVGVAARAVSDLQAPGRHGTTLLYFAVKRTWEHPAAAAVVKELLSAGANPNHTNGQSNSFALAAAVHGPAEVLRVMLEAGGNPNAQDELGRPIVFNNWRLRYHREQQRARLQMLLDRGADVNSTLPATDEQCPGCPLLLYRTKMGREDETAYADALYLLARGADPQQAAADRMTFLRYVAQERERLTARGPLLPEGFAQLTDWVQKRGGVREAE
jgi:hypothetical protein